MLLPHSVDWCMAQPNTCTHMHNAFELCSCDALAFIPMQHSLSILISNFKSFEKKFCI
jgi:hypothetical protein